MIDRVLVIGLDGATWDLLDPLMAAGEMPNLARLLERSARGVCRSSIPPITAAAWTSFATGQNPGKHGLVDFVYFPKHGYRVGIANSTTRAAPALWELLSAHRKRVGVVGVPMTYPPEPINGVMVTDMMTPNASVEYTYPPQLKQELLDCVGPFVITPGEGAPPSQPARYLEQVRSDVSRSAQYALYLLGKERYDFFMYVFGATDVLQHQFWNLLAARAETLDRGARELRERVIGIYREVDRNLGALLDLVDDKTLVILMSDHGFGPIRGFLHINNLLLERGYLVLKSSALSRLKQALYRAGVTPQNVHLSLQRLGLDLRRRLNRGRAYGLLRRMFLSFDDVDWPRTRAFALGHIGQIYINLKGRQPLGLVEPGTEYQAAREQIRADLLALKHPATGEALIGQVLDREDIYSGPLLDQAPDLLLLPHDWNYVAFGESEFASNRIAGPALGHTGHHRLEGIVALAGENVRTGEELEGTNLVDLAPTILNALSLPIPEDMDGRVLSEAFTPEWTAAPASTRVQPGLVAEPAERAQVGPDYSEEQEAEVLRRLGDLGYIS